MFRIFALALLTLLPFSSYAEMTQDELKAVLQPRIDGLMFLTKNAMILDAIREQNRTAASLDAIKKIDEEWKAGKSPLIEELQSNKVGAFLKNIIVQQSDVYNEAFVTDAQGANVAAFPATSDYWQGDEDKFTKAFAGGKGEVFIGDVEQDESTKQTAVQISVPMLYNKEAIGVLVIGVKVSVLEAEKLKAAK
ncbi:MAG TPA: PDC sensor domain-containing protein [Dongiaceae bacterium]|nr:PDC sensor domain-containing protein [Dongiaceae bacterium]